MMKLVMKLAAAALALGAQPALAQITTIDPNDAGAYEAAPQASDTQAVENPVPVDEFTEIDDPGAQEQPADSSAQATAPVTPPSDRIAREDIFTAAEGVFGQGAEGLAGIIEDILRDQGEPVAYIAGQEAGGALVVGVRYGSGTMRHKIEGDKLVYWTGPSIGFDAGADASKVFILVYNLHDTKELFRSYAAAEGNAYLVGGFKASYLRRGDVVLIPVRMGVGVRLGVNAGYMRFTEKSRWIPF